VYSARAEQKAGCHLSRLPSRGAKVVHKSREESNLVTARLRIRAISPCLRTSVPHIPEDGFTVSPARPATNAGSALTGWASRRERVNRRTSSRPDGRYPCLPRALLRFRPDT
jgi:hypothetical protein